MTGSILHPPERPQVTVRCDVFPLSKPFTIARGDKAEARTVYVEILDRSLRGRGECVPYPRYGETVESVIEAIEQVAPALETGMITRRSLRRAMPPGAARNGVDLALWDFDAKRTASSAWQIGALDVPHRVVTAFTISLDTPEAMAAAAIEEAHRPLLKLKLGAEGDLDRVQAVRQAVPRARLIVDANEGWTPGELERYLPKLADAGVELVEQPLRAEEDEALARIARSIPICADESCHTREDLERLAGRYDAINIKLDKAGGMSEALALLEAGREAGFKIMIGCMVGSSLAVAPAVLLAQDADWVDLDAPLLLKRDRQPGLRYDGSMLYPPSVSLWG
ncbi:MAG TPA: N-acetyl-D-Glu racemase DgcA [Aliidongia sp.]|nr:N-acetyl-D-Glu racemase DgcA [Aliidongia sp.]